MTRPLPGSRRPSERRFARAAVLAALCLAGAGAQAQTPPTATANAAIAQQRFDRGRGFFDQHNFSEALTEFRASLESFRSPNTRLYIGLCLVQLGQVAEGWTELTRAANEAGDLAAQDRRYAQTRQTALEEASGVEPRIGRLMVRVERPVQGLVVRVQNAEVGAPAWGVEVPYDPGEVVVTAEAPGHAPWRRVVRVEAGGHHSVDVVMASGTTPDPSSGPVVVRRQNGGEPAPTTHGGGVRTGGFVVGAIGLAGLGVFTAFGLMARSAYDDLVTACNDRPCPASRTLDVQSGERQQLIANVGGAVGAAALLTGIIMIAAGGPTTEAPAGQVRVEVDPSRGTVGVRGAF